MKLRTWCIRIGHILTKTGSGVRSALLLMLVFFANAANAEIDTQGITIRQQNVTLEKVFQAIEKQSGYRFFYNESLLEGAGKVSLNLQNVSLQEALEACFKDQPFGYTIVEKTIIVKRKVVAAVPRTVSNSTMNKIIAVSGKVTSGDKPVVGATVTVKGTDNATSTDNEGMFSLGEVDDQSTLVVSHVSHQAREVRLEGKNFIAIDLNAKVNDLDEAIVVAYNTTTQKRNTGSVSVVKGDQIVSLPNRSVDKSLQGLVPGLQITNGTGQPGGGISNMVIRGVSTGTDAFFGSTVRNPLIVLDGIPISQDYFQFNITATATPVTNPIAQLNPSDIETITVLKDASAIALYGSKASNGVILITTKRGSIGKTTFSFRHQTDIASMLKGKVELLNQDEYLELLYETYKNTNSSQWTDAAIRKDLFSKFPYQVLGSDTSFYPAADWMNELYVKNATTFSNEFSMSGGNEKSNFYLNIEYTKQNGIVRKTDYDRKSIRLNFENRPASWIKLGINTTMSYNIQNYSNPFEDVLSYAIGPVMSPLNPIRYEDGNYILNYSWGSTQSSSSMVANPVAAADYNINRNVSYRGLSKVYGELRLLKYMTFNSAVGIDFMLAESKEKVDPRLVAPGIGVGVGSIQEKDLRRGNIITTNLLRYDRSFSSKHQINFLLGQEAQIINEKGLMAAVQGLNDPYYDQISNGKTILGIGGYNSKQTLLSLFTQANYGFKRKYFLSTSVRRDGASKFGDRQQWGTYWSLGTGWLVSEEKFIKNSIPWMYYLKLRGSIGAAGSSSAISASTRYDQLDLTRFLNNTAIVPRDQPGNPDVQWEETFTWDAGLETRLFYDRVTVNADIYNRKTSKLIYPINLPTASGYSRVLDNIGDIKNWGAEFMISTNIIQRRNFKWNVNLNWSQNKNKLIKANVPLATLTGNLLANEEGRNFNSFYLYRWAGVDPATGSPMWIDSTGIPNTIFSAAKKEFVGKPQPDGFGAITNTITLNNLEFSARLYYQYGFQIFDNSMSGALLDDGASPYVNQMKQALDRWQKPGDIASNPKRKLNNTDGRRRPSTRYLFDGDYIRLQNVTIAYNFPINVLVPLHLTALRVYLQGCNLATWTKYPGIDPDMSNIGGSIDRPYPNQRTFSIGVNVNF